MPKKKLLVVDDEPDIVELLTTRLTTAGFAICSASDGTMALEKVKSEKPDLIVMDVLMPHISGLEAMQKIRQDTETQKIPAIIFSGKAGMGDFFEGISRVEFIKKPLDSKLLIDRIVALIGSPLRDEGQPKRAVLAGVEELLVNRIRDFLIEQNFQVLVALNENEAVALSEKFHPDMVLCQFWEDQNILDPRTIAEKLSLQPAISGTPFYVFCKDALSLEAMKYFKPENIFTYKESSDLLRKLEALVLSDPHPPARR